MQINYGEEFRAINKEILLAGAFIDFCFIAGGSVKKSDEVMIFLG